MKNKERPWALTKKGPIHEVKKDHEGLKSQQEGKKKEIIIIIIIVGVLGPETHYPHLYWAQTLSRGLGSSEEEKTPSRGPTLVNDQVGQGYEGTIKYAEDKGHLG